MSEIGACTKRAAAARTDKGQKGKRRETHGGRTGRYIHSEDRRIKPEEGTPTQLHLFS